MDFTIITDASHAEDIAGYGVVIKPEFPISGRHEIRLHGAFKNVSRSTSGEVLAVGQALHAVASFKNDLKRGSKILVVTDCSRVLGLIRNHLSPFQEEIPTFRLIQSLRQSGIRIVGQHQRAHIAFDGSWLTGLHAWCDRSARSAMLYAQN
jgi:ribonuclease HI